MVCALLSHILPQSEWYVSHINSNNSAPISCLIRHAPRYVGRVIECLHERCEQRGKKEYVYVCVWGMRDGGDLPDLPQRALLLLVSPPSPHVSWMRLSLLAIHASSGGGHAGRGRWRRMVGAITERVIVSVDEAARHLFALGIISPLLDLFIFPDPTRPLPFSCCIEVTLSFPHVHTCLVLDGRTFSFFLLPLPYVLDKDVHVLQQGTTG